MAHLKKTSMKFLRKMQSKTWSPEKSKTEENGRLDTARDIAPHSKPNLPVVPQKPIASHQIFAQRNPYRFSTSLTMDSSPSRPLQPIASPKTSHSPSLGKGMTKVTSFLNLGKAKSEPLSPSRFNSPTSLKETEGPDQDTHASPAVSPTSTYSPYSDTFHITRSSAIDPDTPTTLINEDNDDDVIADTKLEIRALKIADVASTQNALRLGYEACDTCIATQTRLHEQGERLANAESHLQKAGVQNRIAGERIRELKQSYKMLKIKNPFLSTKRSLKAHTEAHRAEREERDALRRKQWEVAFRKKVTVRFVTEGPDGSRNLIERAKYQFEPDSEDDEFEDAIEENLERLGEVVPVLKEVAIQMGEIVREQNASLGGLVAKADEVDDEIVRNEYKLGGIH